MGIHTLTSALGSSRETSIAFDQFYFYKKEQDKSRRNVKFDKAGGGKKITEIIMHLLLVFFVGGPYPSGLKCRVLVGSTYERIKRLHSTSDSFMYL